MDNEDSKNHKPKPWNKLKKRQRSKTKRPIQNSKKVTSQPNNLPQEDKYLTEQQVAELTGFSVKFLQKLRRRGTGGPPYMKVGRSIRYKWSDVIKWMGSHRVER
jgi:predicted DNA-binding transcriptional regulator AlpA